MTIRVIALICFLTTAALAQAKSIDEFVEPFAKAGHFSGVVLAEKDGKVIYEKAFGLANVEHTVGNRLNTKFGIASITKPMTTVVLLRLIEAGKISPADKLSKFIPGFPNGDKITIEMIGRHRSGIPHRVMSEEDETRPFTPAQFVERVKEAELEFEPGTKELYSSAGYAVLARTLEIASGEAFEVLLRKHVFAPAELEDTIDFDSTRIMKNRAECYLLGSEGYTAAPLKDYSFLVGAGSVFSTARDVYAFAKANIDGKYGENAKLNLVRKGVFSSNGATNGYRANVRIDTEGKYGYVVVSNMASGANDVIIGSLRDFLEGKEVPRPAIPKPKVDLAVENELKDYVGRYRLGGSGFNILVNRGELFAGPFKLLPLGKDKFYSFFSYAEVTFIRDDSGNVTGLEWVGARGKSDWKRE